MNSFRAVIAAKKKRAVVDQRQKVNAAKDMPDKIGSLIDDLDDLDVRIAKARLQSILKAIRITRNSLEIEFRG